jgi:hypothetical protein
MSRLSAAVTNDDWDKVRENMRAILDVDPAMRRSPLNWNVQDQEQHHFHYEPVGALDREVEREDTKTTESRSCDDGKNAFKISTTNKEKRMMATYPRS